ncbi:MAG: cation:proton antiporter [Pseudomonadota bacterium]
MEIPLLKDILIIFGLAIGVILLGHRIRIPSSVGFLITGILVGPHGLKLIKATHEVEILAEVGVVLLLFTIGIEFSLKNFLRIKMSILIGGALQVLLTILVTFFIARQLDLGTEQSLFIGFLVSLSSTAIVLKILQERAQIESPHGQTALAILIFQDIIVIPMMLLVPFFAGKADQGQESLIGLILKGVGIILFVVVSTKWIAPKLLYQIARTRIRELFLLSILLICFAVALFTYSLGLSLALGAFLAGLIISETEFSHATLGNILPFKDVFTSLFFVSIGMLLDIKFLLHRPVLVILIILSVLVLKSILTGLSVILLGLPIRTAILVALSLCQVGEFSFILFMKGAEYGLLSGDFYQLFLNVAVLTMGITPFAIALSPRFADLALKMPFPGILLKGHARGLIPADIKNKQMMEDHLIIVGFGLNGKNVAKAARVAGIPYLIIEMNPETVRQRRKEGEPIYYGDATQEAVLNHARIEKGRVMVIVISDPLAIRRIVAVSRKMNPRIFIIARTRFTTEMKALFELGANEVIPEEFETSIEIFSRTLAKYLIPRDVIERLITEARADGYQMFRSLSQDPTSFCELGLQIPDMEIITFRVNDGAPVEGKLLSQIRLRSKYGVTLLAIRRDDKILPNPGGEAKVLGGDLLVLLGSPTRLSGLNELFEKP